MGDLRNNQLLTPDPDGAAHHNDVCSFGDAVVNDIDGDEILIFPK